MDAVEMLKEKARLTKNCNMDCVDCRLHRTNNDVNFHCEDLPREDPQKYVEIIEQWSKDCPKQTYLSKLLEVFPYIELDENGVPVHICPSALGLKDLMCSEKCIDCWNQEWEA